MRERKVRRPRITRLTHRCVADTINGATILVRAGESPSDWGFAALNLRNARRLRDWLSKAIEWMEQSDEGATRIRPRDDRAGKRHLAQRTCVGNWPCDAIRAADALDRLALEVASEGAVLAMAVARLGGTVEGAPTHRGNFLQRIDELVAIEAALPAKLEAAWKAALGAAEEYYDIGWTLHLMEPGDQRWWRDRMAIDLAALTSEGDKP